MFDNKHNYQLLIITILLYIEVAKCLVVTKTDNEKFPNSLRVAENYTLNIQFKYVSLKG